MRHLVYLLLAVLTLSTCEQDDSNDPQELRHRWILMGLHSPADVQPVAGAGPYVLDLTQPAVFSLRLDVNRCEGTWTAAPGGEIDFPTFGCTYVCCDSPFAEELARLLRDIDRFRLDDRQLTLRSAIGDELWFLRD